MTRNLDRDQLQCNRDAKYSNRDDEAELEKIIDKKTFVAGVEIILSSAGVSMGDQDYVKPLLERRGKMHFSNVTVYSCLIL
ncbi:hypothetical protein RND81_14G177800 [Saponaria officinalis]|uniref:Uncharacterized protein n=1 Tax=Saponaria officinalis TaxID=3572 RepID=A0AAW1GND8_SAPOF